MKVSKWEIGVLMLAFFLVGFELGLIYGSNIAAKIQKSETISLADAFRVDYYKLMDSKGRVVGYQRIDFDTISYSRDGHNWTFEPIRYIRKERIKKWGEK